MATPGDYPTNLELWLKADGITGLVDGDPIGSWSDDSGASHPASASGGSRPTYKTNVVAGKPVARFSGAQYMTSAASTSGAAQTVVAVVKPTNLGAVNTIRGGTASSGAVGGLQFRIEPASSSYLMFVKEGVAVVGTGNVAVTAGAFHVITGVWDDATNAYSFTIDGNAAGSGTSSVNLTASRTTTIGANGSPGAFPYSPSEWLYGDLGEVAAWSRVLSPTELSAVVSGLQTKWGLASVSVAVAAPAWALAVDAKNPTVSAGVGVNVAAPTLALAVDARNPTVALGSNVTVSAPAVGLTVDVKDPVVSFGTVVNVTPPLLSLALDVADPTVLAASSVTVAAPVLGVATTVPAPSVGLPTEVWRETSVANERWITSPVIAPPSERTRWRETAVAGEDMDFPPRAVATPPALEVAPIKRLGMLMPAMSASNKNPVPYEGGFDIERGDVGRLQTIIGGRNVTFVRDIPTTLDRFASEAPLCDTQATVRFALDPWDQFGAGDLSNIDGDAQVDVILVRPDGDVEYKWEGFVSSWEESSTESGEDYTVQCEGLFMQAAHWPWDPPVVAELRDVGHVVADALNSVPNRRWRKIPRVTTGILTSERGESGWSTWQYVSTVLAKAWTTDGRQWSLTRVARRTYRIVLKASTTAPTWTVTKGAPGVEVSLRKDHSTRRDAIFARGFAKDGGFWCGRVFPSLDFGVPPRYPMNNAGLNLDGRSDSTTDTGNGITVWQRQMRDLGYPIRIDGVMNIGDAQWVRKVQRDKGITVDGSLGPQTWNATFEDNSHDADLTTYRVPLAFDDSWPWRYSASGTRTLRTDRDTTVILHAMPEVDWGTDSNKTSMIEPTRRMLQRDLEPGWTGTVTLKSDPWETGSSRLDVKPGDNILILGHYGGTVVQVASADHQDEASVFAVDTKARDAMGLDAIRDRDREARRDAAGRGKSSDRSRLNNAQVVQYESESKAGFISRTAVNGNTGLWSVRKAFVSQVGVAKVEFDALSPKAEIVAAIFNRPIRTSVLASLAPDPLADDDKWYEHEKVLKEKYGLMEVFGSSSNPGGYYPRQKGDGPLTGELRDMAGLPYDSPYGGFVWVALFTSRSTWVEGRMYPAVPQ